MLRYFAFFFCFASALEEYSPNYFCADMTPQRIVIVPQLMGMWYGVEKIDHLDERHYVRKMSICPIIHISEDHASTTPNPLYRNNQHRSYGEGYGYATGGSQHKHSKTQEQVNQERQQRLEHERGTEYERNHPRRLYQNYNSERRYLRVYWDEEGVSTEYHVRYNVSEPGFWISSGPENGVALKSQFSHYAGNIQVLKAVGDHMVLTFCHQLPERQLYSILLARETKLSPIEIHSIHRMLNRKGLHTNAVEKLCNNSGTSFALNNYLSLFLIVIFIYKTVK